MKTLRFHKAPGSAADRNSQGRPGAFTLVELLVTISVLAVLMTLMTDIINRTTNTVSYARERTETFQEARSAFESLTRRLAQASMDATWACKWNTAATDSYFERVSDHHFVLGRATDLVETSPESGQAVFFQAPLGFAGELAGTANSNLLSLDRAHDLVNCWGYYVQFDNLEVERRPAFMQTAAGKLINPERRRFKLMEFRQPAEQNILYSPTLAINTATTKQGLYRWFRGPYKGGAGSKTFAECSTPLADNILMLVLVPHAIETISGTTGTGATTFTPAADYSYDSRKFQWSPTAVDGKRTRHQLPAMVQVTMIAASEGSYERFETKQGNTEAAAAAVRAVLNNRFVTHAQHDGDLAAVETGLTDLGITHKTFTSAVALRGAKWITAQE